MQSRRGESCSSTGSPAFGTEISVIATPQIIRFQNPASTRRKSPGLLQLPLLPPGAAQFLASRLEMDGVVDASLVTTRYRSTSTKLYGLSIAAGTYDSLHLLGTPPKASPSQPFHRPAASRWELQRPRDEVPAAETASRDAFSAAVERLLQQLLRLRLFQNLRVLRSSGPQL
ncbi:uncharacterized protein TrAFT101_005077 [Trichoderma asperellum]|uniref:Uncharacterized protein n=1 Tax=Trichoderma asperellum (strain ATCC 204424 / CBS 433.97 / NBRC 101777) TaxID=1042311 RepID=A0A2T3Z4Y5_TRIA4|nr:hypothetical protein M441DRAFT_47776 [Trichoderma asperellum CBS 433.97]PTB39886.1 hypothetical protein M441DRAFT_47776 [Trichoderma asperellum CBS 433.97]UKZ90044.1 hypothetical protein TrAFT101_005077 [Trichoderma asperellum]